MSKRHNYSGKSPSGTENRLPGSGFEEIPHTADWSLRAWAVDLTGLFIQSALGMNTLAGARLASGARIHRTLTLTAPDAESLLVAFLSELVYLGEKEKLAFDGFDLQVDGQRLKGGIDGARLASVNKIIKAVTYHNMVIRKTVRGVEVEIVFDV